MSHIWNHWRTLNNRQFRLVSYVSLGAGWIPAARIRESTEGMVTITPIQDATRLFATEEEANNAALAMAITWMNSNSPPTLHAAALDGGRSIQAGQRSPSAPSRQASGSS